MINLLSDYPKYEMVVSMWLNEKQVNDSAINVYRETLLDSCPNHVVIDNLFDEAKLEKVIRVLQQPHNWKTQKHTYSASYVDSKRWQKTSNSERFVQRDVWQRQGLSSNNDSGNSKISNDNPNIAQDFLSYLRADEFMSLLSGIFNVQITDKNVADPEINTNYFRLGMSDFIKQHADDSPGREVCMLLYLNKDWDNERGGDLVFIGQNNQPIRITPLYNRCVLFDPSSKGSEHWVEALKTKSTDEYRYNVTSWYWSE